MKVITIKQPYADLIKTGLKEYEFRTWKTNYRGEVLIHAGKSIDMKNIKKYNDLNLEFKTGVILASAKIVDCIKVDDEFRKMLKEQNELVYQNIINDSSWEGYAFKLEDVKPYKEIKVNGQLGLWNLK